MVAFVPTMKSIGGAEGKKTDKKEESEPAVKIDLSKVTERRNRPETHDFKRNSRVLRAGRAGRKDLCGDHKSAAEEDDGYRLRGYADQCST